MAKKEYESDVDGIKQRTAKLEKEFSPTFCLAKWHHTSIYMYSGQTHSCYHPRPHDISVQDIKINPAALHNTRQKKKERAEMLVGEKPDGCKYCWNVESLDTPETPYEQQHISDRKIRNSSIYTPERVEEIKNMPWDYDVNPEYIEVAFHNECNFKCGYCHPAVSTSFYNEIKKFGPYNMVKNHALDIDYIEKSSLLSSLKDEDNNPFVKAWWEWWPEMSKTLNILRITGGEPLLHKSTWRLFEDLKENPKPHLEINVNSNLGMSSRHVQKLVPKITELLDTKKIRKFKMFTSMDTWGKRAEYLRTGLDIETWEKNQDIYVRGVKSHITHMCTFNILSVTSFTDYLQKILDWRELYDDVIPVLDPKNPQDRKIRFDTPYLKEPLQYDMHILPKEEYLPHFDKILQFINDNRDDNDTTKFSNIEYERFRRVSDYFAEVQYDEEKVKQGRIDFYNWFTEIDRRRNTNFLETFPDMSSFWDLCKGLAEERTRDRIDIVNVS